MNTKNIWGLVNSKNEVRGRFKHYFTAVSMLSHYQKMYMENLKVVNLEKLKNETQLEK
jgi:hypothetical protein